MSQINESPIIQIERRKAIAIIAAAAILASSLGFGLTKVGSGFASRAANGITVTGSSTADATADNAIWTLNVSLSRPNVSDAVIKVGSDVSAVTKYILEGGIPESALTLGAVSTFANEEYINGNLTGRILSYRASRDITVRSEDVQLISQLSQGIGSILQSGVSVNNYGPQYYISDLPKLRPKLLEEAMKDAKVRAEAITQAVGGDIGKVISVRSGVFQVVTPDSKAASDIGAYDNYNIENTITSTVSVTFQVK